MAGTGKAALGRMGRLMMVGTFALAGGCQLTDALTSAAVEEEERKRVSTATLRADDPQAPIGKRQHPRILSAFGGAYQDGKLQNLLAVVAADLVAESDAAGSAFTITVLDTPQVNAFALPGGYLYVTRGLIALANDASEIAAVLAHEMAHVSADHGVERIAQTRATEIASRVADRMSDSLAREVARERTERKLASFSRAQELQADALGIALAGRAGFDPLAATRFLSSMRRWSDYRSGSGGDSAMSATHPATPRRLELAGLHARRVGPPGTGRKGRDRYLAGVDGMVFGPSPKSGLVSGRNFQSAGTGLSFDVPKGFELKKDGEAVTANGPDRTAIRYDRAPRDGEDPSAYLASGWVNGLDEASIAGTEVGGRPAATGQAFAGGWRFAVLVVAGEDAFHRFLVAAPTEGADPAAVAGTLRGSTRFMSDRERSGIKPFRLKVVSVGAGDTIAALSERMATGGERLFKALNALDTDRQLQRAGQVKIVTR